MESSFIPLAEELEKYIQHRIDIITDSDWFAELIEEEVNKKMGVSSNGKTSSSNLEDVGSIPTTSAKIEGDKNG